MVSGEIDLTTARGQSSLTRSPIHLSLASLTTLLISCRPMACPGSAGRTVRTFNIGGNEPCVGLLPAKW